MTDTEFIQHMLDICAEARTRASFAHSELVQKRGLEILRKCVRLAHDMCRMYGIRPSDVDGRLVDRELLR